MKSIMSRAGLRRQHESMLMVIGGFRREVPSDRANRRPGWVHEAVGPSAICSSVYPVGITRHVRRGAITGKCEVRPHVTVSHGVREGLGRDPDRVLAGERRAVERPSGDWKSLKWPTDRPHHASLTLW